MCFVVKHWVVVHMTWPRSHRALVWMDEVGVYVRHNWLCRGSFCLCVVRCGLVWCVVIGGVVCIFVVVLVLGFVHVVCVLVWACCCARVYAMGLFASQALAVPSATGVWPSCCRHPTHEDPQHDGSCQHCRSPEL